MDFAPKRPPVLKDHVIEFEVRRKTDCALNLRGTRLRKPTEVDAAERETRTVCDLKRRQNSPFDLERPAFHARHLAQGVCRPTHPRERVRRDAHSVRRIGMERVRLAAAGKNALLCVRSHLRSVDAVPFLEVLYEPRNRRRVGTRHRHINRLVECDWRGYVRPARPGTRQRQGFHRIHGLGILRYDERRQAKTNCLNPVHHIHSHLLYLTTITIPGIDATRNAAPTALTGA